VELIRKLKKNLVKTEHKQQVTVARGEYVSTGQIIFLLDLARQLFI
jgi:hypothetical protein